MTACLLAPSAEAARSCQVTARAIRFYEELGLIQTQRDSLNRRCVDAANREKLAFIARLRRGGVSLFNIGKALDLLALEGGVLEFESFVDALVQKRTEDLKAQMCALEEPSEVAALAMRYARPPTGGLAIGAADRPALSLLASRHETPRECVRP